MKLRGALFFFAILGACGGGGPFTLTGGDNDPAALQQVLAARAPDGAIQNRLGVPAVVVASANELALIDLSKGAPVWTVPAAVTSRIAVGRDVVAAREGDKLVSRAVESGAVLWSAAIGGELVGHAAGGGTVLITTKSGKDWTVRAYDARSGSSRWEAGAGGRLGAPVVARGIALVPFLNQWLAVLDAKTGKSLTRVRSVEEEIEFTQRRGAAVFFGSSRGAFLFDEKAASGSRAQSHYGSAALPPAFSSLRYGRDAYNPADAKYNARDRRQLLWDAVASEDALEFVDGAVGVHYFRFLFALDADDQRLRWVYSHPRTDLIAAQHLGPTVAAVAIDGAFVALDVKTGAQIATGMTGVKGPLVGGTFDAHGWRPSGSPTGPETTAVLVTILADRDSRFASIKSFAIDALAQMPSTEATSALIDVAVAGRAPFAAQATEALVTRGDAAGASALIKHLVAGTTATDAKRCVAICARALAAIESSAIAPNELARANATLLSLFASPKTTDLELAAVALALGRHGGEAGIDAMRMFFLVHRGDPNVATNQEAVRAIVEALAAAGGSARAAVGFAASDPVTIREIALEAQRALQLGSGQETQAAAGDDAEESAASDGP